MKRLLTILAIFISAQAVIAQKQNVGIGTSNPDNSALLDLSASDKGLLIPRMSMEQRERIVNPANGLLIFQTGEDEGFFYFTNKGWKPLSVSEAKSIAAANPDNWSVTGNTGMTAGINFIGGDIPLEFRQGGTRIGLLSTGTNTFLGRRAGIANTANFNVGIGYNALEANTTGGFNNSIGYASLSANTTGEGNTAVGSYALWSNTTGYWNVGIGQNSLVYNTTGAGNTAIAGDALYDNTTGNFNTAIGRGALHDNTSGSSNLAIGSGALYRAGGNNNLAIGNNAGYNNVGGFGNVFIGLDAGKDETGSGQLYIANSDTPNPLVKGDFNNSTLKINSKTTGYLAVGNWDDSTPMPTPAGYRLIVQDGVLTEKVKVALRTSSTDWADYVFSDNYVLMPIEEVASFIQKNKHLPNVPSAEEMVESGLDVAKTSKMFMEKIEELTLYMIELNKRIDTLEAENRLLKNK